MFPKRKYKRGNLIVSDINLTKRKYFKLDLDYMIKNYPKKWHKKIYKKRCK